MKKYKVVFAGLLDPALKKIFTEKALTDAEVVFIDRGIALEDAAEKLWDADFLVVHKSSIPPVDLLKKAERLKLLQTFSIGTGHIPVQLAAERGIPVSFAG